MSLPSSIQCVIATAYHAQAAQDFIYSSCARHASHEMCAECVTCAKQNIDLLVCNEPSTSMQSILRVSRGRATIDVHKPCLSILLMIYSLSTHRQHEIHRKSRSICKFPWKSQELPRKRSIQRKRARCAGCAAQAGPFSNKCFNMKRILHITVLLTEGSIPS